MSIRSFYVYWQGRGDPALFGRGNRTPAIGQLLYFYFYLNHCFLLSVIPERFCRESNL